MDWAGRVWGYTGGGGMIQGFAAGYFLWDLCVCVAHVDVFGWGLLAHAVAALVVFSLGFVSVLLLLLVIWLLGDVSVVFKTDDIVLGCRDPLSTTTARLSSSTSSPRRF